MSDSIQHDGAPVAHTAHDHHQMPTSGSALTGVAISATLHCLTGCAIGEILGMVIGTAAGLHNGATVVLSLALAFAFGYGLTVLGVRRAGVSVAAGALQRRGFIRYHRGRVMVLDRQGLEDSACECYAVAKAEFNGLLGAARPRRRNNRA